MSFLNSVITRLFATVAFLAIGSIPLSADIVLYNQQTDNNSAYASQNATAGAGSFSTVYDNFTLGATDNIDGVTWVGSFFGTAGLNTITSFVVSFYANNAGTPGALLNSTTITGNANQTSLGNDNNGDPEFGYTATLSSLFQATATTEYWLSIVATTGPTTPQWGWESSSGAGDPGDHAAYQVFFGAGSPITTDLAFSLSGNPVGAVPEPFSLALLGTVIALVSIEPLRRRMTN